MPHTDPRKRLFTIRLRQLRDDGYNVSRLERALEGEIETIGMEFIRFEEEVKELQRLGEKVQKITDPAVTDLKHEILSKLNDPDQIEAVRQKAKDLEGKLKELSRARLAFRKRLEKYRGKGYDV